MGWRLIDSNVTDPYFVTAADDAISEARKKNEVANTLHFYRRDPAAVSVGRSRKIHEDINVNECIKQNVKIIRRTSGGGSIYTDEKCLIYSLIFNNKDEKLQSSQIIFENICKSIIDVFKKFDITAIYKPPNDIFLNNKKISGSAQIKKENIVLIHGTILIDTDLDKIKKVLKNPKQNVTTIRKETGQIISLGDIKNELKKEFEGYFNTSMEKTTFSKYEKKLIKKLLKNRYNNDKWNFMR